MRHVFIAAALAAAVVTFAAGVRADPADDNMALSDWLARCQSDRQPCLRNLTAGYDVAYEDMAEICPPDGLTAAAAAETELRWLENAAAANKGLASGRELDAEWTALHTLWPCSH